MTHILKLYRPVYKWYRNGVGTITSIERRLGRPIDTGKRAAVLAAAQQLFLSNGFARTSMDAVAEVAGVSKLTAYKYFGSKQELFAEAIADKCASAFTGIDIENSAGHDVRGSLEAFGRAFLRLVLDPGAMAVHRIITTERDRSPELGQMFLDNAVRPISDKLATIVARHEEAGRIATGEDPMMAAQDLLALWRNRPYMMIELAGAAADPELLAAHVAHCVDLCLKAWRP